MPAPRKVDLLPGEVRRWLEAALKARGFAGYDEIAEELNWKLAEMGTELRIQKSALHAFGQDFKAYAERERAIQSEIRAFMHEADLDDEAKVTKGLFQQLVSIQWQLQKQMHQDEGQLPDPKGMKDLTTALNNLIRSAALRDAIVKTYRKELAAKVDQAVEAGEVPEDFRAEARRIMGFA
jgi:hypothetical protein